MGTNFYAKVAVSEADYYKMQELLKNRQFEDLQEMLIKANKKYHIGKRSCGWQFLFEPHKDLYSPWLEPNPWDNTLESLKQFLAREDVTIEDEYGTTYTSDQFWNEEIGEFLYNDPVHYKNGLQAESTNNIYSANRFEFTTEEGLRFSKQHDFA